MTPLAYVVAGAAGALVVTVALWVRDGLAARARRAGVPPIPRRDLERLTDRDDGTAS